MTKDFRRTKLIECRKNKNWLQRDVVEKLSEELKINISESYYGMIEQGVRTPSLSIAMAISSLFKVEINEIFFASNTTLCCVSNKNKTA